MKSREVFHALMSSKGFTHADLAMSGEWRDVPLEKEA
jgi:hypothetical protein